MAEPSENVQSFVTPAELGVKPRRAWLFALRERLIGASLIGAAGFSLMITAAIIVVLFGEAARFFGMPEVSLIGYLTGNEWNPLLGGEKKFGMWPLVTGTLMVTFIAAIVAIPLGLVTAVYLSEYASPRTRAVLKPVLEILAGIPTVVYGFFALTIISPYFLIAPARFVTGLLTGDERQVFNFTNSTSAGIAVGIMCLPTVVSLSEDALRAVPRALREGAYGLGATRFDVSVKVVVPAALSGVVAAFILAIARAVGETMIVALAAGGLAQMAFGPEPPSPSYGVRLEAGVEARFDPNDHPDAARMVTGEDAPSASVSRTVPATFSYDEATGIVDVIITPGESAAAERLAFSARSFVPTGPDGIPDDDAMQRLEALLPTLGDRSTVELYYDADRGVADNLVFRPGASSQTMTAYMVQIFLGDVEFASVEYHSSYAVGATLFLMTLTLTLLGNVVLRRFREAYD